jgi:transposase
MSGYLIGTDRSQTTLFPERLEDFVDANNPVRAVDAFIDALDLRDLAFVRALPAATGRPGYDPGMLLKLYVYGYLNRIPSIRRLEREAQRNIELMWLTGRLAPDHKTIADFRRDNGPAIRKVCARFVVLCRQLGLLGGDAVVAIDGSKFKAVNNRDFTPAKLARRTADLDGAISRYLVEMDEIDRADPMSEAKVERLTERIGRMREEKERMKNIETDVARSPDGQVSLTDPDARSMKTRGSGVVGYNVQAAVEARHHLIVVHDVVMTGSDRAQLSPMACAAREAIGRDMGDVVADRGYYSGHEVLACEQADISAHVPKTNTSNAVADGRFGKEDFVYEPSSNIYRCPAGQVLKHCATANENDMRIHIYATNHCPACLLKAKCTTGNQRRVRRWEYEQVLDAMEKRLAEKPDLMTIRRSTVEHVFGTIKSWMGATHFLTRRIGNVQTEMSLQVLA